MKTRTNIGTSTPALVPYRHALTHSWTHGLFLRIRGTSSTSTRISCFLASYGYCECLLRRRRLVPTVLDSYYPCIRTTHYPLARTRTST
eukprot:scaffold97698_cov19-Prasinocladus_malaysianus.AAC.1